MAARLWKTASINAFNTTLNGNVTAGDSSITLTSVTGLDTGGGVLVIDRQDANNVNTPTVREYISYTAISSMTLTGVSRGLGGSTAQAHNSNAKVEECFSISHWNDFLTAILNILTAAGALDTTKVVDLTTAQTLTNKNLTAPTITGTIAGTPTITGPTITGPTITGTIAGTPTITTPTITKPVMSATNPTAQTYSPAGAGTATLDLSLSNQHQITMPAGNITIALSNDTNSQPFTVSITQDSVGSRTVTWFTTIKWAGGSAPTLTTTALKRDTFGFIRTGSGTYDGFVIGQNI